MICSQCAKEQDTKPTKTGQPRTPHGWKMIAGKPYCRECKTQAYALRAVSIPVASCDWKAVMPALYAAWNRSTAVANWLVTQFYAADSRPTEPNQKLAKWSAPYLYPAARVLFPDLDAQSLVSVINTVQSKYRASRLDLWRSKVSLPTFRDLPLPLHRQQWTLTLERERWHFSFRNSGTWHDLILRGGGEFHRQIEQMKLIAADTAQAGEAALYQRKSDASSKPVLMLKIAAYFPRYTALGNATATVKARTAENGFLIAVSSTGAVWRLNADQVQRWIVGSAKQQQRLREDLKAERRFPKPMREGIVRRMGELADRRHGRIDAWSHEASMQLVKWAKRQKACKLIWDDSYPSVLPSFPWYILSQRIEQKCAMAGIEFATASEYVPEKMPEPLAEQVNL